MSTTRPTRKPEKEVKGQKFNVKSDEVKLLGKTELGVGCAKRRREGCGN